MLYDPRTSPSGRQTHRISRLLRQPLLAHHTSITAISPATFRQYLRQHSGNGLLSQSAQADFAAARRPPSGAVSTACSQPPATIPATSSAASRPPTPPCKGIFQAHSTHPPTGAACASGNTGKISATIPATFSATAALLPTHHRSPRTSEKRKNDRNFRQHSLQRKHRPLYRPPRQPHHHLCQQPGDVVAASYRR